MPNPLINRKTLFGIASAASGGYTPPAGTANFPEDAFSDYSANANLLNLNGGKNGTNVYTINWQSVYNDATFIQSGASLAPDAIGNLQQWVKADQIVGLNDGDPVSTWSDQSGNARDFTGVGAARPTYNTNVQNGLPGLNFNGAKGMTGSYTISAQPYSIAIVLKANSDPGANVTRIALQGATSWVIGSTSGFIGHYNGTDDWAYGVAITTNPLVIVTTSATGRGRCYIDGARASEIATVTTPGLVDLGNIGANVLDSIFRIFEVAIYNIELTPTQVYGLSLNLSTKWGT